MDLKDIALKNVNPQELAGRKDIVELQHEGKSLGLFLLDDILDYRISHTIPTQVLMRTYGSTEWGALASNAALKKKQSMTFSATIELPSTTMSKANFYLLEHGQKKGPFNYYDILDRLQAQKLLYTDLISVNDSNKWVKIFQIKELDRRGGESANELPSIPQSTSTDTQYDEDTQAMHRIDDTSDAIAGLVVLGNKSSKDEVTRKSTPQKSEERTNHKVTEEETSLGPIISPKKEFSSYLALSLVILGSFILLAIYATQAPKKDVLSTRKSSNSGNVYRPNQEANDSMNSNVEALESPSSNQVSPLPTKSNGRARKVVTRRPTRGQTPFSKSKAYRSSKKLRDDPTNHSKDVGEAGMVDDPAMPEGPDLADNGMPAEELQPINNYSEEPSESESAPEENSDDPNAKLLRPEPINLDDPTSTEQDLFDEEEEGL
ncbi:MAG: hypothetical protein A2504_02945 [Bdellovibrionales bacterium RIFOXYD12_FULL_39_22]|nr:MAG: hypothetical protein A2385_05660 [Bdellovibrionales bacterium RIFOXYB1_FULL_39_21]OFZ42239.1 MAG: hypothetical protein A2485_15690 [Bdellovibrionales bacterium RIFOXYC12_FULL_39_17]OFZ46669.1 MAG: hypothetical protein A2404_03980 [Bdellovibrionales bacterium RIFOXYC1_FULL_39_130]OFZ76054.1 MAG: hypothetical protein A2560_03170 [Bdellovibrionales bacterium RIFOXYD1_FULL_39_84]OFZ93038.1 MAG: hypothetical protein A2504_02945 [Bdellovibrionales bacterium RIFOXYD12_FULL_39_22]HLE09932.1 hy